MSAQCFHNDAMRCQETNLQSLIINIIDNFFFMMIFKTSFLNQQSFKKCSGFFHPRKIRKIFEDLWNKKLAKNIFYGVGGPENFSVKPVSKLFLT